MLRPVADRHALGPALEGGVRRQADELGLGHGRVALDRLEQRRQRQRLVVLDVARDLGDAAARGERQADRAQARQPLPRRPRGWRGDRPRVVVGRRRAELEVEGDERRARGDEDRARGRVHARGAEVGRRPSAIRCASPAAPPRRSSARVRPPASRP